MTNSSMQPSRDLYCIRLLARPGAGDAGGTLQLGRASSPFDVSLTVDGLQRYNVTAELHDLPPPRCGGMNQRAWGALRAILVRRSPRSAPIGHAASRAEAAQWRLDRHHALHAGPLLAGRQHYRRPHSRGFHAQHPCLVAALEISFRRRDHRAGIPDHGVGES